MGTSRGIIYFFPDVDRLFVETVSPADNVQKLNIGAGVSIVQWDAQGRRFLCADVSISSPDDPLHAHRDRQRRKEVKIIDLMPTYHTDVHSSERRPVLQGARILRLRHFKDRYRRLSLDLQLTRTGLWLISGLSVSLRDIQRDRQVGPNDDYDAARHARPSAKRTCLYFF